MLIQGIDWLPSLAKDFFKVFVVLNFLLLVKKVQTDLPIVVERAELFLNERLYFCDAIVSFILHLIVN